MCQCEDYNKCSKCGRYTCDSTIGHQNAPTESIIECVHGGVKKWVWKRTENGIEYDFQKQNS